MAESSNTTSSQNQTSASSKLPDKSLELESHQRAYIQSTPHILHTHHGSKPSRRWLACSMGTICSTHYSFEEFKRIFHVQSEISCELNIKMKTWNTGLHIIELSLRDKMQQHSIYMYYWLRVFFRFSIFHPALSGKKILTFGTLHRSAFTGFLRQSQWICFLPFT